MTGPGPDVGEQILGFLLIAAILTAAVAVLVVDERRIRRARRRATTTPLTLPDEIADLLRMGFTVHRRAFDWSLDDPDLADGPTTRERLRANAQRN